jgi:hypothetical protein
MIKRSRLSERIESQTRRNVIVTLIGIAFIVILLWKFGVPLLASVSFMLAGGNDQQTTKSKPAYVAPPSLNDTFSATNSAAVTINGTSLSEATVDLYVNNSHVDSTTVGKDNTFTFDHVSLHLGDNSIKAQATLQGTKSDYSNMLSITYLNKQPELSIDNPSDGQEFHKDDKSVDVKGKTDPGVKVTVNDFWAIVDTDGNYSYTLSLHDGDNDIKVVATDDAGNKAEKALKVKYSQ